MNAPILDHATLDDRQLVERHLAGDRGAFAEIVARHQAMVCALTLSACGDVGRSEDLAQEVFVTAWKKLPELREPEKLRAWLAGIARNAGRHSWRDDRRTPTARAEELSPQLAGAEDDPRTRASGADETELMWRMLESVPEIYREPMMLYYRQECSVSAVAAVLEISEEVVRQRLVRGRAMLNDRVTRALEETLVRTGPTAAFGVAVLVALGKSGVVAKTTTASIGVAAAKGGIAIKLLAGLAAVPSLLGGWAEYRQFRRHYEAPLAEDGRERVVRAYVWPLVANAATLGILAFVIYEGRLASLHPAWYAVLLIGLVTGSVVVTAVMKRRLELASAAGRNTPPATAGFEYRSKSGWLGLPWVHVKTGGPKRWRVARGWIAVSDGVALGGLVAAAPFSAGLVAVGAISIGGLALGAMALGGAALGGTAVGWVAAGGMAAGWQAAVGGMAVAHDFAFGGMAWAMHVNDATAATFFQTSRFFQFEDAAWRIALWTAWFGWLPPLGLIAWHVWRRRAAR